MADDCYFIQEMLYVLMISTNLDHRIQPATLSAEDIPLAASDDI